MSECRIAWTGQAVTITPTSNRLDAASAPRFKGECLPHASRASAVVVDLRHVEFLDSSGLGVLVSLLKATSGSSLELANVGAGVPMLLQLTRLDRVLTIRDSEATAHGEQQSV